MLTLIIVYYFFFLTSLLEMNKRPFVSAAEAVLDEPVSKKQQKEKYHSQSGLNDFFQTSGDPDFPFARKCGIKVYSPSEILSAESVMEQRFRTYWNNKAEEICRDRECYRRLKSKQAIQGAIHSSWILKKTEFIFVEAERMRQVAREIYSVETLPKKLVTLDNNIDRLQKAHSCVTTLYETLSADSPFEKLQDVGNKIETEMATIKKCQESLRKAMERLRTDITHNIVKGDKSERLKDLCCTVTETELSDIIDDIKITTGESSSCSSTLGFLPGLQEYDSD